MPDKVTLARVSILKIVVIGELLVLLSSLSCGIKIKDDTLIQVDIPNRDTLTSLYCPAFRAPSKWYLAQAPLWPKRGP